MTKPGDEPKEIREDLESIKELLEEDAQRPSVPLLEESEDVPILDDTVEVETDDAGLPESTFKTLLSDAWQESVQELFNDARALGEYLPEDIDTLSAALKLRIDKSVREWLEETLRANIDLLRQRMVHELSEELLAQLRAKLREEQEKAK